MTPTSAAEHETAFAPPVMGDWGVYLSGEAVFLKPYQAEGESPGFDTEAGHRLVGGINGKDGLGIRFRWFEWDQFNRNNAGVGGLIERIDLETIDAELTKIFQFGNLSGVASAGYRYADYREFGSGDADQMRNSNGLTVSLELSHMLTDYFSVFGKARASLQAARKGLDNGAPVSNLFFTTAEIQLGAEANLWKFEGGGRVFIRGAVEAQSWSGGLIGDGDSEDLGLFGGSILAGVQMPLGPGQSDASHGFATAGLNSSTSPNTNQSGAYLGGEAVFLKPYESEGEAPGFDTEAGHRVVAGISGEDGLGVRFRWFEWGEFNRNNAGVAGLIERLNLKTIDAELTKSFAHGNLSGVASAGYRYADYREFGFGDADQMRNSNGLVIGLELSHMLTDHISVFGKGRASLQFASKGMETGTPRTDLFFTTAEIQLGAEATLWNFEGGGRVFIRGAAEGQSWSGGVIGDGDQEDLGLFGGTILAGLHVPLAPSQSEASEAASTAGLLSSSTPGDDHIGLYFGGEVPLLKPFQSEGEAPGFNLEAGHRVVGGLEGNDGLGLRFRWFQWDQFNRNNAGGQPLIERIDLETIDVELTKKISIGSVLAIASAGYRYADYREFGFFDADQMRNSNGLVVGLELSHMLTDYLSVFGKARASMQFASKGLDNGAPMSDMFFTTSEVQLGAEATLWKFGEGGRLFVRGAAEGQGWSGGVIGDGDSEDLALFGGAFLAGVHMPL
ncbi:MAG: hypothetical protein GY948_07985 [Alphaproteobacteria bacterium]|nr:hypothetical protein [Alphaproteobacteria bacterium]